jgi:hypothetical protein
MVAKEGEVSLEVGITLERAQRDRKVL